MLCIGLIHSTHHHPNFVAFRLRPEHSIKRKLITPGHKLESLTRNPKKKTRQGTWKWQFVGYQCSADSNTHTLAHTCFFCSAPSLWQHPRAPFVLIFCHSSALLKAIFSLHEKINFVIHKIPMVWGLQQEQQKLHYLIWMTGRQVVRTAKICQQKEKN